MTNQKQIAIIAAYRLDLQAMKNGTYVPPRPHRILSAVDTTDEMIDDIAALDLKPKRAA